MLIVQLPPVAPKYVCNRKGPYPRFPLNGINKQVLDLASWHKDNSHKYMNLVCVRVCVCVCVLQEVAVKELLTVSGRPISLRKTTSVPNINQVCTGAP